MGIELERIPVLDGFHLEGKRAMSQKISRVNPLQVILITKSTGRGIVPSLNLGFGNNRHL